MNIQEPIKLYLASPYTDKSPKVREKRFFAISVTVAQLTLVGYNVYSPILNGHIISQHINFPYKYDFWAARDRQFIEWCDRFYIVKLEGWEQSKGIEDEIEIAKELNKTITYFEPIYPG